MLDKKSSFVQDGDRNLQQTVLEKVIVMKVMISLLVDLERSVIFLQTKKGLLIMTDERLILRSS